MGNASGVLLKMERTSLHFESHAQKPTSDPPTHRQQSRRANSHATGLTVQRRFSATIKIKTIGLMKSEAANYTAGVLDDAIRALIPPPQEKP